MVFHSIPEDITREWFDTAQAGSSSIKLPEPDIDYCYAAARLLSFFPVVNSKGATYFPEDIDDALLQTLIGKQANLEHDKTRIIGTICSASQTDDGIDIGVRVDRECAELQGLDVTDMRSGHYFSHVSVELTKDMDDSWFLAVDDGFNVIQAIPVSIGRSMNIRRTTARDPYKFRGHRVVERIKPARFTGVGFVPNPADKTAALFAVSADDKTEDTMKSAPQSVPSAPVWTDGGSHIPVWAEDHEEMSKDALTQGADYADPGYQEDGKKRYPLETREHTVAASRFFGKAKNREKYTEPEVQHIDSKIAEAKRRFQVGDEDDAKQSASAETPKEKANMNETELQSRVESLEADVARLTAEKEQASQAVAHTGELSAKVVSLTNALSAKETELASITAERDALKTEKETAARESAIDSLVGELVAIMPAKDEADLAALRESASKYVDDAGVIRVIKLERENLALKAALAEKEAAPAPGQELPADTKTEDTPAKEGEKASDGSFRANAPKTAIGPTFGTGKSGGASRDELLAAF